MLACALTDSTAAKLEAEFTSVSVVLAHSPSLIGFATHLFLQLEFGRHGCV
jgi:hypothetical protein